LTPLRSGLVGGKSWSESGAGRKPVPLPCPKGSKGKRGQASCPPRAKRERPASPAARSPLPVLDHSPRQGLDPFATRRWPPRWDPPTPGGPGLSCRHGPPGPGECVRTSLAELVPGDSSWVAYPILIDSELDSPVTKTPVFHIEPNVTDAPVPPPGVPGTIGSFGLNVKSPSRRSLPATFKECGRRLIRNSGLPV
jgi:hypothetical protein